ncbi:MAG TPA: 5'/3'-nucleotidase SurE [Vicinamibacteria bacterium]|nr:5'/3'-nucleotidase SurE [Vicinamibacteria bacterium]
MPEKPVILVTNDDGIHSPGIRALAEALQGLGNVHVVAPDREQSACSHSLTLKHPLRVERLEERWHAVDGTPADCVNLACAKLLSRRPDLVCSGINRGGNLGDDVFYSGTVGGAREGVFFGIPSIAVSLASKAETDFSHAAAFAARLAKEVMERGLPPATLLNVNVPARAPRGAMLTVQGRRQHYGEVLEGLDPRRQTYYWIEEGRDRWQADDLADVSAVRHGFISVTPLHTDTTHHGALSGLRPWLQALPFKG